MDTGELSVIHPARRRVLVAPFPSRLCFPQTESQLPQQAAYGTGADLDLQRRSWRAILRMARRGHFRSRMEWPPAGVLFPPACAHPLLANSLPFHLSSQKLWRFCGRLQPGIKAALPLLQHNVEQNDSRFQFRRQLAPQPQAPRSPGTWAGLPAATVAYAAALPPGKSGRTHLPPPDALPFCADKAGARAV